MSPPSLPSDVPPVPRWKPAEPTREEVEWADILTVDLSLYDTQKDRLVETVATALQRDGFFYVVGHGIPIETVSALVAGGTLCSSMIAA